ncbi:unnamed protein product [Caenorhabditis auriculariae]|uniref:Acyl-CoA dehydrogenase 6 n=1 Tax=Caenorhabditis auriculariae TaxID=2777116 RepID=A0A8S1GYM3_9PELO|nr:unnamed protein product [Caenorhabditis auriculariae]
MFQRSRSKPGDIKKWKATKSGQTNRAKTAAVSCFFLRHWHPTSSDNDDGMAAAATTSRSTKALRPHHILYDERHLAVQQTLRKIIDDKINPQVRDWERDGIFPAHQVFKTLGRVGIFAANKPQKYGGLGKDFSLSIAVAEELGSIACGSVPMSLLVQSDMATPALAEYGSDELRETFLRPSISGDVVACIAVSEPHAGSDVSAIRTTARRSGGDLILNGTKMWITNGEQADWACVLANSVDNSDIHHNKSLICVPLHSEGVHRSRRLEKLGMRCSDTVQLFFDDVRVPVKNIIGREGYGFLQQMKQFNDERLVTVAVALAPLQKCISDTLNYARDRRIFGSTLLDQQYIQYGLAELQIELEATRSLLYRTVLARLDGEDVSLLTAMAKLKVGRLARKVTDRCLQVWGGAGYLDESHIARCFRDLRVFSIGAGSDEVMLSIVHKHMRRC